MLGLSSGLIKGTSVLRSIVKKGLQAWYKADKTQAPLGEEEIANGSFDTGPDLFSDASNWVFDHGGEGASYNTSTNVLTIDNSSGGGGARQIVTTSIGDTFLCTFTIDSISGYAGGDGVYFRAAATEGTTRTTAGTYSEYITVASVTGNDDRIDIRGNDDGTATISNISVKKTNPNDSWSKVTTTGSTVEFKDGAVDLVTDGANVNIQQTILTVGKKYKAEIDFTKNSGDGVKVQDGGGLVIGNISSSGLHSFDFTATNAIFLIARDGSSAGNYTVNSVSVKEITNSVKDFSPNNNNGVLYSGKCLDFDGAGDYITIADDDSLDVGTGDFTLAAWVYCDNLTTGQVIMSKLNTSTGYELYKGTGAGGSRILLDVDDGSGAKQSYDFGTTSSLSANTWYRIVVVADRDSNLNLYTNGKLISSLTDSSAGETWSTFSSDSLDSTADFTIGAKSLDQTLPWFGMMADVQLYKKAWTFSDVAYDYNNPDKDVFDDEGRAAMTIGSELFTNANPASVINESSSIETSPLGIPSWTHNFITSDSSVTNNSNFSIKFQAISSGNRSYIDLNQTLTIGKQYKLQVDVRHVGSGDNFILQFNRENTLNTGVNQKVIATITSSDTDFVTYTEIFVHDGSTRFFGVKENGNNYDAGGYIDNLTIKEYQSAAIPPTDCKALYRLNEGAGDRVYNAAPVLSAELIDNSDFSLGESGFTTESKLISDGGSSSITIANGKATYNIVNGENVYLRQLFGIVSGRTYKLSITVKGLSGLSATSNQIRVQDDIDESRLGIDPNPLQIDLDGTLQTVETVWTAGSGSDSVMVMRNDGGVNDSYSFEVHNLSVKEISLSDSYVQTSWAASNWIKAQPYIPQYAMSSYSKKMIFDGTDDYVELGTQKVIPAADPFSFSFWYYNIDESADQPILGRDGSTSDYLSLDGGHEGLIYKANNVNRYITFNSELTTGKLNHIVFTSTGGEVTDGLKCYVNGVIQTDTENSLSADFHYRDIMHSQGTFGEGFIDELAHFNKVLSVTEVQEIFNAGMALDCRDHSASSDLTGYWRNNGVDTWTDLSTNSNNGTVNGSPTTIQLQEVPYFKKDTFGLPMNKVRERALNLDGDSYIEIADDNSLDFGTGAFSIDGWARFAFENSGSSSGNAILVSGGNPVGATSGSFAILTNIGGDTRSIKFLVNGEEIDANITSRVADGDWFHFAATRDTSGNLELYIDSESVGTLSATGNSGATVSTTAVRSIGRDSTSSTRNYKNLIDDVRLYDRELLANEVAKNYKAAKSKHKNNIVSNWSDDFSDSFI